MTVAAQPCKSYKQEVVTLKGPGNYKKRFRYTEEMSLKMTPKKCTHNRTVKKINVYSRSLKLNV